MTMLSELSAFAQILMIDLSLAGDNVIVVGMATMGLPKALRRKAIFFGILAATVLRILFALFTVELLKITGLTLAGGLLLLWVCWKLYSHLRQESKKEKASAAAAATDPLGEDHPDAPDPAAKLSPLEIRAKLKNAITQIVLADVSMSLDNVLGVAGAAREHLWVLVFGLVFSVFLMGVTASWVARLLNRFAWIGYAGLIVILYVAVRMILDGTHEVLPYAAPLIGG